MASRTKGQTAASQAAEVNLDQSDRAHSAMGQDNQLVILSHSDTIPQTMTKQDPKVNNPVTMAPPTTIYQDCYE